ncbi:ABC transporter ATP-binding protein [Kribbella italica]|uniref:Iron complex transport system ATP-binding protein n=1 Tax=Kribbella italica TaxID=1540520 RepID=A0A7W9J667_9ACTN|nr:ABC transporter ATP-binding protein [Kribbella italica]MBB5835842.1 iron complex transport system ATP-binding protein [Kribbella italica]
MTALVATGIDWSVDGVRILDQVDLVAPTGQVLGVLGPNGAGKTSLLRVLAGLRPPDRGTVSLGGKPLRGTSRRTVARRLAIVEQSPEVHSDITVDETVALGRTPHRGIFAALGRDDHVAIEHALEVTGMTAFRDRSWRTLSGGERQRAQLARALAQQPKTIVLDEPTNHLDIRYQLEMLTLLSGLGLTVVTALHDLNLAARFCDQLVVLFKGRVVATGTPTQVITAPLIHEVYGIDAVVERSPHTGAPTATFLTPAPRR